jgi:hypothetical protein
MALFSSPKRAVREKVLFRKPRKALAAPFTGVFYGLRSFGCKNAQFCVTQRERWTAKPSSGRKGVRTGEKGRKNSL